MAPHKDDKGSGADSDNEPVVKREVIPEAVDYFLGKLLDAVSTRKVQEVHKLYEDDFNTLSKEHYRTKHWPSVDAVARQVSENTLFLILYKELYYRHVFSRLAGDKITFEDRKGSWDNYRRLLDLIIDDLREDGDLKPVLPAQWIWDILDEFVYHYQVYQAFISKAVKVGNNAHEKFLTAAKEHPEVFETKQVLLYLVQLVSASKIEEYLVDKKGGTGHAFTDETTRLLGYFSLQQLLRMHSLLGDYHLAMKTIHKIDLGADVPLFYKIPACHVSLYYYMGFAYMMMRRYEDSIRTFSEILVFLSKTNRGVNSLSYQYEAMAKKREQMYALMMISLALSPRQIDESLEKTIQDQHSEKQARLQRGEELAFEELFNYSCPKFVSAAPSWEEAQASEAHQRQLKLFKKEMKQQELLPRIGSYMKLYTAIKTSKLAQLCEMAPDDLRDQLMCVMHKTNQKVRTTGMPLDGDSQFCGEVEFYLDGDMVHINAQRPERAHGEVFMEQIGKFKDLLQKM